MTGGHAAEHAGHAGHSGQSGQSGQSRFGGLHIPEPQFADDDGCADPGLAAALGRLATGAASLGEVVAALAGRRLMVPLLAVLDSLEDAALTPVGPGEKDSHMATVSLVGADGRRGLLAFTSVAAMAAWDPAARGIPATAARVAAAALDEGADAVLLDVAGPHTCVLEGPALRATVTGLPWTPAWEDVDVRAAVDEALRGIPGLAGHRLVPGQAPAGDAAPDLLVQLRTADADPSAVAAAAQAAADALAESEVLAVRCPGGVGLALG